MFEMLFNCAKLYIGKYHHSSMKIFEIIQLLGYFIYRQPDAHSIHLYKLE